MCMNVANRLYVHCAASLWLVLNFGIAIHSSDCDAVRNFLLNTILGSSGVLAKRTVLQGRDLNAL